MAESSKTTPVLLLLVAVFVAYAGWSGDGINLLGMSGMKARIAHVDSTRDSLNYFKAKVDTADKDLAKESIDDVKKRSAMWSAQLNVLRTLVPESREIPDLLDDVSNRAKARGITLSSAITPHAGILGPGPFETYSYQMSVIGHYHNIGQFFTDIASLRRIIVPTDIVMKSAPIEKARVLGDTTSMLEVTFNIKTYVKQGSEGSVHEK